MLASQVSARLCCKPAAPVTRLPRSIRSYAGLAQSKFLKVSEEVRDAVATGRPVVALESTIYTHGMHLSTNAGPR